MARSYGYRRARRPAYRRKSSRGGGLTGGTGDTNPQWMPLTSFTVSGSSAAGTVGQSTNIVPVPPSVMMGGGRQLVMEILKVEMNISSYGQFLTAGATGTAVQSMQLSLSTKNHAGVTGNTTACAPTSGHNIACAQWFPSAQDEMCGQSFTIDLTDETGHGVIFAGQNIYLMATNISQSGIYTGARTIQGRLLYRWKGVGLKEYIGVVTSQLSA